MARHTYGEPPGDDDILEVQGVDYPMQSVGMRAIRRMLAARSKLVDENADPTEKVDLAISLIVDTVKPDHRDRLREHIEESVHPKLVTRMALDIMRSFESDVDPTQPESSSDGSSPTGSGSTAGALPAPSLPTS